MKFTARLLSLAIATTTQLLLLTSAAMAVQLWPSGGCVPGERDALLAFKKGITDDRRDLLASWQEEDHDCCRWRGVWCSNRTGHVLKLNLRNNINPHDYDPTNETIELVGKISHSLLSLQHLQHLDLSYNSLEGPTGYMPEFLGSLNNLRYLNLSGIPFHGLVPPHLGNLSELLILDISSLSSTENSYSTDISWVTHLSRLQYLNMGGVNLSKVVDWPHVVNMVSSLRVLDLSCCNLAIANQNLPHLNLTNLGELRLQSNNFYHPIASCWFWNVESLKYLDLGSNDLYGQIPDAIGNLTSLEVLDFSAFFDTNHMDDHAGSIVVSNMTNLCNLRILDLSFSLSHGNITEILERLPHCPSDRLNELYLRSNNISGKLPDWIWKFAGIIKLDLSYNHLTGVVPFEINMLTNLTDISLRRNYLNGHITKEYFANLAGLKSIGLSGNSLNIVFDLDWLPPFRLTYAAFSSCHLGPLFPAWLHVKSYVGFYICDKKLTIEL